MDGLEKALGDLARLTDRWMRTTSLAAQGLALEAGAETAPPQVPSRLEEVPDFGPNPGALRLFQYRPETLAPEPALVVVLHGCTQTAAAYDIGSGWSMLADRYGFVVLYPEQRADNNPKTCFNWFSRRDTTEGRGEAGSIRAMVDWAVKAHGIAPGRVFITGLSAGAAMAVVMLALHPELFAAGAVIAGMPFRAATTVSGALSAMFEGKARPAHDWGDLVRAASGHAGPWPRLSIWQGDADTVVVPSNARELEKQWLDVHGIDPKSGHAGPVDGYPRRVWSAADGRPVVESWTIAGMGHGTPLDTHLPGGGVAGPFMLDVGVSSTFRIAEFFGLTGARLAQPAGVEPSPPAPATLPADAGAVPPLAARMPALAEAGPVLSGAGRGAVAEDPAGVPVPVPSGPPSAGGTAPVPDAAGPPEAPPAGDWGTPDDGPAAGGPPADGGWATGFGRFGRGVQAGVARVRQVATGLVARLRGPRS